MASAEGPHAALLLLEWAPWWPPFWASERGASPTWGRGTTRCGTRVSDRRPKDAAVTGSILIVVASPDQESPIARVGYMEKLNVSVISPHFRRLHPWDQRGPAH